MSKNIFTQEDFNSPDGMMTTIWGPPLWHVLHTISFNYPIHPTKEDKDNYLTYFKCLKYILPCSYCRENLKKNLKKFPLKKCVFKSRDTLSMWVYLLHEEVNNMLGKKSNLTYDMVRSRYEQFRSRCLNEGELTTKKDTGCTKSLYGVKGKCVLSIVPKSAAVNTFNIDPLCKIKAK